MNNPIIMHCNYVEQGQTIDEMCDIAVRAGFDGIEFRRKRFNVEEKPTDYLNAVERAVKRSGLKRVVFGAPGPNLALPDADARKREVDEVIAFYRDAARRFDLTVCNTMSGILKSDAPFLEFDKHGSAIATDEQFQAIVDGFRILGDLANELGFRFAFETHNVYYHDLPDAARRLVDAIDRNSVGINLDYGNIILYPDVSWPLDKTMQACKGRVYLLHLKNLYLIAGQRYYNFICCPLSDGAINNRQFLKLAREQNYDGPIVIEQPREGDRVGYITEDLAYLKQLMREIA